MHLTQLSIRQSTIAVVSALSFPVVHHIALVTHIKSKFYQTSSTKWTILGIFQQKGVNAPTETFDNIWYWLVSG